MKALFFCLFTSISLAQSNLQVLPNAAALKNKDIATQTGNDYVYLPINATANDGKGGTYQWCLTCTGTEDAYGNQIASLKSASGFWVRTNNRLVVLPGGMLVTNGGLKTFYVNGTTDVNGQITVNLTMENTSTGTSIFSDLRQTTAQMTNINTTMQNATSFYVSAKASDLKTITLQFYKGNTTLLNALGLNVVTYSAAAAGVAQSLKFEGF